MTAITSATGQLGFIGVVIWAGHRARLLESGFKLIAYDRNRPKRNNSLHRAVRSREAWQAFGQL